MAMTKVPLRSEDYFLVFEIIVTTVMTINWYTTPSSPKKLTTTKNIIFQTFFFNVTHSKNHMLHCEPLYQCVINQIKTLFTRFI